MSAGLRIFATEALEIRALLTPVTVEILANRDTTIYSDSGLLANGQGHHLIVGSKPDGSGYIRNSLVYFDLASAGIPAGSVIENVVLTMNVNQQLGAEASISLNPLSTNWGEGESDAGGDEYEGAPAQAGDATWTHAFYSTEAWDEGGSFSNTSSASTTVSGSGEYAWQSSSLTDDVQAWSDDPDQNFGWAVRAPDTLFSATRINSAESGNNGPTLTVTFDAPQPPGTIQGRKWHDTNANGQRESNEPWLNGWTIELVNASGTVIDTAVTADVDLDGSGSINLETESGVYLFEVVPGEYTIREVQKPGWVQAAPGLISSLDGSTSETATGAVWYALDSLSNELSFQVSLSQLPGNLTDIAIRQGQPGGNGSVLYDLLQSGTVDGDTVSGTIEISPDHANQIGAGQLHIDVEVSSGDSLAGLIVNSEEHRVIVTADAEIKDRDFGNYQSGLISGRKYYDANADGVRIPQSVIELELYQQDQTYFENAYGQNEKWLRSPSGSWFFITPDGLLTHWDVTPFVAQGVPIAQLDPRVYDDPQLATNVVNDPFLNGWTIELLNSSGVVVASTRTQDIDLNGDGIIDPETETGWYRFAGLAPGDYTVREIMQDGWYQSATRHSQMAQLAFDLDSQFDFKDLGKFFTDFAGAGEHWLQGADGTWYFLLPNGELRIWDNASGGDNGPLRGTLLTRLDQTVYRNPDMLVDAVDPTITLLSGDEYLNANFGNFQTSTVEGRKWHDENRDGSRIPIEVQQLQLLQHDSSFFFNAYGENESWFRDEGGSWYYLTPTGSLHRWDNTLHVAQGELVAEVDEFFAVNPELLLQTETEPYLNDFTIQLIDEFGNVVATDVTRDMDLNEDGIIDPELERGWYSFTDVLPGNYTLREIQQDGWIQTFPVEPEFADLAVELDAQFGFQSSGNLHENFGGMDEVWIQDAAGDWYYILPDGQLFEWDRMSTDPLVGVLIAELSPQFHANPSLLYNAKPIDIDLYGGDTVSTYNFGNDLLSDVV